MQEAGSFQVDKSISVGGSIVSGALVTGNNNNTSIQLQKASLPQKASIDIYSELALVRQIFDGFQDPIAFGISQKLEEETVKSEPDKQSILDVLEIGLNYIKTLSEFTNTIAQLRPRIEAIVSWIGKHSYKLLPLVGLTI